LLEQHLDMHDEAERLYRCDYTATIQRLYSDYTATIQVPLSLSPSLSHALYRSLSLSQPLDRCVCVCEGV
jgi:hypothetical protein